MQPMQDPHVVRLKYNLRTDSMLEFKNASPVEAETDHFRLRLSEEGVSVDLKEHHATVETARQRVEQYLQAWRVSECLKEGRPALHFEFADSEVIDRNPLPPTPGVVSLSGSCVIEVKCSATLRVVRSRYPEPVTRFAASPEVLLMWRRFELFLEGKEPLLSVGYVCLSLIEGSTGLKTGARDAAATMYSVERLILKTLGEVTSTKGGPEEARKLDVGATQTPLTTQEGAWVQAAIKLLIRRKGEYDHDPSTPLPLLKMSDLPAI
jgi:hypothetical protein